MERIGAERALPNPILTPVIEWRARRIGDPVERLRFLRRMAGVRLPRPGKNARKMGLYLGLLAALAAIPAYNSSVGHSLGRPQAALRPVLHERQAPQEVPSIWPVEQNREFELYSNGLRIENRFQTPGAPREYGLIDRRAPEKGFKEWRTAPAGIVFHTTESEIAPFESGKNQTLRRLGMSLLEYVRAQRAYNFVIDRFGRVYRIVPEGETANHAGFSIWEDANWYYLNLNTSFIGISFEARSTANTDTVSVNPAQFHAGKVLADMLRGRFGIDAANCVTHAQVSVNPENMRIGYHTDWAGSFPFPEMGLPDNYSRALPSLYAFGFTYDPTFVNATGASLWLGVARGEQEMRLASAAAGLTVPEYRRVLQQRYRKNLLALKASSAVQGEKQ